MIAHATIQTEVDAYIDRVLDGRQVACATVIGACRRHRADLERISDPEFPYEFNPRLASRSCQFFPLILTHSKGQWAGQPFDLADWQKFCIWCIFGWVQKLDGKRRFRRVYISVARKNGKSTLVAGIALLAMYLDGESGAEVYVGATKKEQAAIIFGEAQQMVRSSPWLSKLTTIHRNNMLFRDTNSFMRAVGSDRPLSGPNPHAALFDELHEFTEVHRKFFETMTSGSIARRQPLFVVATTAGDERSHIWRAEDDHARRVSQSEIADDRTFAYIASLDKEDDPYDESVWEKANPNLGVSVTLDALRIEAADAKSKAFGRNKFLRYHCNRLVSSVEHCFTHEDWMALRAEWSDWKTAEAIGIGIDLGGRDDLAAWGACAKFKIGEEDGKPVYRYELRARSYIVANAKRDITQPPWSRWLWERKLTSTDHVIALLKDDVVAFSLEHGSTAVAFDPHNARQLGDELEAAGLTVYSMGQNGGQYNEPLREFVNAATTNRIAHDGDEILAWAASNMAIRKNARDEWMPDKRHSKDKIDPIVACIMAFRVAYFASPRPTGSLFITV